MLALIACKDHSETKTAESTAASTLPIVKDTIPSPQFEVFKSFPDTIVACSGVFSENASELKKQNFLFISNMEGLGIIHQNGKTVYLKRTSRKENKDQTYEEIYAAGEIVVTLKVVKFGLTADELTSNTGTLTIMRGKQSTTMKTFGETGC
jgi:hypothetical protein